MGNITSSSSKESIPTTKQDIKLDVTSSIDRGGRENTDERVAKRPRFTENDDHIIDKVHNTEDEQKHITNTVSPSLTHSMPGDLLYGSNNCNAVAEAAAVAATSEKETTTFIAQPSLVGMPASIIIKIIQYTSTDKYGFDENAYASPDFRPDILALERTCKPFRDLLAKDETWLKIIGDNGDVYKHTPTHRERAFIPISLSNIRMYQESTENLLLEHLGGADGVRHIATLLLMKVSEDFHMDSNGHCIHSEDEVKVVLRGDTIDYLTEVIQGHMIATGVCRSFSRSNLTVRKLCSELSIDKHINK